MLHYGESTMAESRKTWAALPKRIQEFLHKPLHNIYIKLETYVFEGFYRVLRLVFCF
jgi:hypothetical protein